MEMNEENLQNLDVLLGAMKKDHLGKQDFLNEFKKVVDLVLKIEKRNTDEIEALKQTYAALLEKLRNDHTSSLTDLRKQVDDSFIGERVKQLIDNHIANKLNEVDAKVATLKDGAVGLSGEKGDKGDRGSADSPIEVRDKLELLQGKARLRIDAIDGLIESLEESKKGRRMLGGGFSKIAMDAHFIDDETPSGTVNGVNTIFTLVNTPNPSGSLKVFRGGARQRITEDYTLSGKTITFTIAPVSGEILLADYRH